MGDNPRKGQKRRLPGNNHGIIANSTVNSSCTTMTTGSCTSNSNNKGCSSPTQDALRKSGGGKTRPKPVFFWTNADVIKWLRRCCQEYHSLYAPYFFEHDITGRTLVRVTDITLEKMGITDAKHREELCGEILKLKLKSDIVEMKDLEKKGPEFSTAVAS